MTETFDRLMRETFGSRRRLTLDERRDIASRRGCVVCGGHERLWLPEIDGPGYCVDHHDEAEEGGL